MFMFVMLHESYFFVYFELAQEFVSVSCSSNRLWNTFDLYFWPFILL